MTEEQILKVLENHKKNAISTEDAIHELKGLPFQDIDFAKLDHHRGIRKGFPEVVFCEGKKIDHILKIASVMSERSNTVMFSRANETIFNEMKNNLDKKVEFFEDARIILVGEKFKKRNDKNVLVLSGGTADIPVAEEAFVTCDIMGNNVEKQYDVGVAGLHRLLYNLDKIHTASVIIVVAGMEGALPSVVSGISSVPVVAVPTSIGYGANFGGLSALLSMLNSCAPGICTMNIDNGFGAGYLASMIVNN